MESVLLIDYGSTYTKVVAVDASKPMLLGCASAYTTIETDVREGLGNALKELELKTGIPVFHERLACSSAAGGLRMVASGLVPELTAKAASLASMGAGAKIVGLYSYELIEDDIDEILLKSPDIMLLTGGTDGGNKKCILHNAEMLAKVQCDFPIIVAGNRNAGNDITKILAHHEVYLCENVMPTVGTINIEPARQLIRDIFLKRIVHAKGLSNEVLMPTPSAMLTAMELLATEIGELIGIDVGGATTDVYSITNGAPRGVNVIYRGLPEPYAKRTVEGDIGMRYSAQGVAEAVGMSRIADMTGLSVNAAAKQIRHISEHTDALPESTEQKTLDFTLAAMAIETATIRHAGILEEVFTTSGRAFVQTGKDLTGVETVVLTGGALLYTDRQKELVEYALFNDMEPQSLRPRKVKLLVDNHYILSAMGLLSKYKPTAALELMKSLIRE